jgi:hypothetical protein
LERRSAGAATTSNSPTLPRRQRASAGAGENFAAAAAIKFDLQFDALSKTFTANGNEAGLEAIATLALPRSRRARSRRHRSMLGRTLDAL